MKLSGQGLVKLQSHPLLGTRRWEWIGPGRESPMGGSGPSVTGWTDVGDMEEDS